MGHPTKCYLEGDITNPIDFYYTACFTQREYESLLAKFPDCLDVIKNNTIVAKDVHLVRYYDNKTPLFDEPLLSLLRERELICNPINPVPLPDYTSIYKSVWEKFANEAAGQFDFVLFDGSLLHHPINDLTRIYSASSQEIIFHVNTLLSAVQKLHPQIIYLSSDNVSKRLQSAQISRKKPLLQAEQIQFWENRKETDLAVMQRISIPYPYDMYDISNEDWNSQISEMAARILETEEERRARIYPIVLREYNPDYPLWYAEEKAKLEGLIGAENIARINHYGSTAVPGLVAKPTVDILLEIKEDVDLKHIAELFPSPEYFCQWRDMPDDPLIIYKGYTSIGFAKKVYHVHVRYPGDWDELYFRDYLIAHPETAAKYAALKCKLMHDFENDRDGYTDAKGAFIRTVTAIARS